MVSHDRPGWLVLILIGLVGGLLSGAFGIGGGLVIVPGLVLFAKLSQRRAAGTSVAAILPAAVVGFISYAIQGNVDWAAAILLAAGIIVGAQVGSKLLSELPIQFLRWMFAAFILVVIVSLWIFVPTRDQVIDLDFWTGSGLVLTGFVTGVLSGLLGVGGGIIVVPVLMFFFGASDLIARGTSLLMMVPGSLSATIGNVRRHNVNLRAAAYVGVSASVAAPFGAVLAVVIDPQWSNIAFSVFLVIVFAQMLTSLIRDTRTPPADAAVADANGVKAAAKVRQ